MRIEKPFKGNYKVSQIYGVNPQNYKQYGLNGHEGIDYACSTGTEILACDSGVIIRAITYTGGYGKNIKIYHNWGESVYAHLSQISLTEGAQVQAGQKIGLSGNTGNSTGPHLHFGIRVNPFYGDDGMLGFSDPEPHFTHGEEAMVTYS